MIKKNITRKLSQNNKKNAEVGRWYDCILQFYRHHFVPLRKFFSKFRVGSIMSRNRPTEPNRALFVFFFRRNELPPIEFNLYSAIYTYLH